MWKVFLSCWYNFGALVILKKKSFGHSVTMGIFIFFYIFFSELRHHKSINGKEKDYLIKVPILLNSPSPIVGRIWRDPNSHGIGFLKSHFILSCLHPRSPSFHSNKHDTCKILSFFLSILLPLTFLMGVNFLFPPYDMSRWSFATKVLTLTSTIDLHQKFRAATAMMSLLLHCSPGTAIYMSRWSFATKVLIPDLTKSINLTFGI